MKKKQDPRILDGRRYGLEIYTEPFLWGVSDSVGCQTLPVMEHLVSSVVDSHEGQPLCVVPIKQWLNRGIVWPERDAPLQLAVLSVEDAASPKAGISIYRPEIYKALREVFPDERWVPSTAYNLFRLAERDRQELAEKKIIALEGKVPGYDLADIRACLWRNNFGRCISGGSLDGPYFETARFLVSRPFPAAA